MNQKLVDDGLNVIFNILIAEDDEGLSRLIEKKLQSTGFNIITVLSGAEAINYVIMNPPAMMLLDYQLPDMTGKQVIESLKEQKCDVPFIIITGNGDERVAVDMMKLGARDYLVKDTSFIDLFPTVVKQVIDEILLEKRLQEVKAEIAFERERLKIILDSMIDGVFLINKQYDFVYINSAFKKDFGEVKGQKCYEFFNNITKICAGCKSKEVFQGNTVRYEWYLSKNKRTYDIINTPIHNLDGSICLLEIVRDITEFKKSERELESEKELLTVTLGSIGDGVITSDIDGKIVLMNIVAEKLTGWTRHKAKGQPLNEVFYIIKENNGHYEKTTNSGSAVGYEDNPVLMSRDGIRRIITDTSAHIRDRDGNIIGSVIVFSDITEQYKMREELHKANKLESIGILAGGIAHNFNNILTSIIGNISLAKICMDAENEVFQYLEDAEKSSLDAKRLTKQLLTFAKGGEPVKKIADVSKIINESVNIALINSRIKCEISIVKDLWLFKFDEGQMTQAFSNIITNAVQSMPEGGEIIIRVENITDPNEKDFFMKEGRYIKISIEDNGIGISEERISKIFDPYFTTYPNREGLGLSISYSIIHNHFGYIIVRSKIGVGTIFNIYFPALVSEGVKTKGKGLEPPDNNIRILVMDDDEMIRNVVNSMMKTLGYAVEFAKEGREAIKLFKQAIEMRNPFNAVILDLIITNGLGGKEVITELLKYDPNIKAIVSSGYSNDPVMANYQDYGFTNFIDKPYKIEELNEKILNVINYVYW